MSSPRDARSFFACAIAPNTFLRELPLTLIVSGSARFRRTRIYLLRIPHPKVHSIQRVVPIRRSVQRPASTVPFELDCRRGTSSCITQLGSNNRTSFLLCMSPSVNELSDVCQPLYSFACQLAAIARHSKYVCRRLSICQITVASFRITATRATVLPRRRLIRLYHSRSWRSLRNA